MKKYLTTAMFLLLCNICFAQNNSAAEVTIAGDGDYITKLGSILTISDDPSFGGSVTLGDATTDVTTLNGSLVTDQSLTAATSQFYFKTSNTAPTGDHNNLRTRVQATATGAATGENRSIYAQAVTNASLFGGTMTGVHANFIAKNLSTTVNGRAVFAEAETEATPTALTNLIAVHARTKAHIQPATDHLGMLIENEKMATGFQTDAYLKMRSTTWGAAEASSPYGIDMNSITELGTADIRGHNGEIWSNVQDGAWDGGAANVRSSTYNFADATAVAGGADAITIDFAPDLTIALGTGFRFIAEAANTGAATINVDGAGAVALEEYNGAQSALDANDIRSGQIVEVAWNGTAYVMLSASGN